MFELAEVLEGSNTFQPQRLCRCPIQSRAPHDRPDRSACRPRADRGNKLPVHRFSVKAPFAGDEQIGVPHAPVESEEVQEVVRSDTRDPPRRRSPKPVPRSNKTARIVTLTPKDRERLVAAIGGEAGPEAAPAP